MALTGTALPVLISISPQTKYQFGNCPVGEHTDMLCTVRNDCNTLPVSYQFRRIAHFLAKPANGKVRPQESQEILLSFSPNQIGRSKITSGWINYVFTLIEFDFYFASDSDMYSTGMYRNIIGIGHLWCIYTVRERDRERDRYREQVQRTQWESVVSLVSVPYEHIYTML